MDTRTGYCLKNQGKPWHSHFSKNIPGAFKERAKAAWNAVRRSYEDAFMVLCRKNFFQQVTNRVSTVSADFEPDSLNQFSP
eukprot:573640-Prymnesium_polylepis.1